MRRFLGTWFVASCLVVAATASLCAQDKAPPPPDKVEKNEPAPRKIEPPADAKRYVRDDSTMLVHYLLAAIATIIVMVLICMPIRRE